uniref:Uncharacterized protein n=1 Tax=Siphoviridae sp. ctkJH11 TaxID=2825641 RepID=A0A8S5PSS3_9CAUD|nr:MAG TPA: hypothetical protein [Siphoviridae sp. ctkJH11]
MVFRTLGKIFLFCFSYFTSLFLSYKLLSIIIQ